MKLLTSQLEDKSKTVSMTALAILHEACEVPNCLEQLVKLSPDLLHLGEKGVMLLVRFLSTPTGLAVLKKNNFVVNELRRWDEFVNFRFAYDVFMHVIIDSLFTHFLNVFHSSSE